MSKFKQEFNVIDLKDLHKKAEDKHKNDWRYVQTLAVKTDNGTDLIYSFMKDGTMDNFKIQDVTDRNVVSSISDIYLESFVWENEIHDLWNIKFKDIAIDFEGSFYNVAVDAPMTIVSPEALARKEKQKKIEAALAAKKAKEAKAADAKTEGKGE